MLDIGHGHRGTNRLIRRMMEQVGHPVQRLRRVRFANLELTSRLRPGQWRDLSADELRKLKNVAKAATAKRARIQEESSVQLGLQLTYALCVRLPHKRTLIGELLCAYSMTRSVIV